MVDLDFLLPLPESQTLEWKRDFPASLRTAGKLQEADKGEVLKDLGAMANGLFEGVGYAVYGVADLGDRREVIGLSRAWDDAVFQDWSTQAFFPPLNLAYSEQSHSHLVVGVFEIRVHSEAPHVATQTIGALHQGQVPVRRGTQNHIAIHEELRQLFLGQTPLVSESSNGAVVNHVTEYYRKLGFEPALPRYTQRDDLLMAGYRLALFPGTRRSVVVHSPITNRPELILMLRPRAGDS